MAEQPDQAEQLPAAPTAPYTEPWRWNNQAPPPINGQVRTDTRDWVTAKHVFLSNKTDDGLDVAHVLVQVQLGSPLDLKHRTDPTRNVRYNVSGAPVAQSGYVDFPVTYVQNAGTLPISGTVLLVQMVIPASALTITWKLDPVAKRANRYLITCECPHGVLTEFCATNAGLPVPIQAVVETTAGNLLRRTGCTCSGVAPAAKTADAADAEPEAVELAAP